MTLPSLGERIRLRRRCLRTRKRQNPGEFTIIIGGAISLQFLTGSLHKMDIIGQLLLRRGLNPSKKQCWRVFLGSFYMQMFDTLKPPVLIQR